MGMSDPRRSIQLSDTPSTEPGSKNKRRAKEDTEKPGRPTSGQRPIQLGTNGRFTVRDAAHNAMNIRSLFEVHEGDRNVTQKRAYMAGFGEPLYPTEEMFEKFVELPYKRIRTDQGPPVVDAPTVHERTHIKDVNEARKADFINAIPNLVSASHSIHLKRPIKLMVDQLCQHPMTYRMHEDDLEIYAVGLTVGCTTLGTLNTTLNSCAPERCTENICSAFLALPRDWLQLEKTCCTKKQENFMNMATRIAAELKKNFLQFSLPLFVNWITPHMVNVSEIEIELLVIAVLAGWQAAINLNNSMRGQSNAGTRGQNGDGTPLHPGIVRMLINLRLYRIPTFERVKRRTKDGCSASKD